jgi:RNA polymerase sigma-70 factor (subfamily 1)
VTETPQQAKRVEPSFETLHAAARIGDSAALGLLFERCRPALLVYAAAKMADALHAKAEPADLVQDTFAEAHDSFPRFLGLTEPLLFSWLKRILKNNIADLNRRFSTIRRDFGHEQRLDTPLEMRLIDGEVTPARAAALGEEVSAIRRAMLLLENDDREVLRLRSEEMLSFAEIARRLGKPSADAARKQFDRALHRLERVMGQKLSG